MMTFLGSTRRGFFAFVGVFVFHIVVMTTTTTKAFQSVVNVGGSGTMRRKGGIPSSSSSSSFLLLKSSPTDNNEQEKEEEEEVNSIEELNEKKRELIQLCEESSKASMGTIASKVEEVESIGEMVGVGQSSSFSGLISGEWECIYTPEDVTRSSPFFWAFRKAFPEASEQIFGITDQIPAPIKEVGPAYQTIEYSIDTPEIGTFVSRVKVSTLGGQATSIMTTRATIVGTDGVDALKIKVETTKPEKWSLVQKLFGPFGDMIIDNAPPFPSGDALEQAVPGSSEIILRTTYCDEEIRISRNGEYRTSDEVYIFKRKAFAQTEFL